MKYLMVLLLGMALVLCGPGQASGDMYKWVDKDGNVHFQDDPPEDQSPSARVERIEVRERPSDVGMPVPAGAVPPPGDPSVSAAEAAGPNAAGPPKVEVYGTDWCSVCLRAREYLRSRGIPFDDYDVDNDKAAMRRKMELSSQESVPVTVIGGKVLVGFSEEHFDRALGLRR